MREPWYYISPATVCIVLTVRINEKRSFAGKRGFADVNFENDEFHVVIDVDDPEPGDMTDYYIPAADAAIMVEDSTNYDNCYLGIDEMVKITFENGMFHVVANRKTHN